MLTGILKSQVDRIWDAFWSGGISNPLEVMEQITYLLFLRRLDDLHTLEENKSTRLKLPIEHRVFPEGKDPKARPYDDTGQCQDNLWSAGLPAVGADCDRPQELPSISRRWCDDRLQLLATYDPQASFLKVTVIIVVYGQCQVGWRRDRLQRVAVYHRFMVWVFGSKTCSVCRF
jgi:hypothetical protein